jgi:hypothetical protein
LLHMQQKRKPATSSTPVARRHDLDLSIMASGHKPPSDASSHTCQKVGNRPMSLRPEAMNLDLSVVGLLGIHELCNSFTCWVTSICLSCILYTVLYGFYYTVRRILYSRLQWVSLWVCVHALLCNVFYKVYSTVHRTLLCLSSPVLCEFASIALHCILQSIVLCTLYSTLSSLLSSSLWECVCAVLYGVFCSIMYCTPYSTLSPLSCSLWECVCALLYEVFYEV